MSGSGLTAIFTSLLNIPMTLLQCLPISYPLPQTRQAQCSSLQIPNRYGISGRQRGKPKGIGSRLSFFGSRKSESDYDSLRKPGAESRKPAPVFEDPDSFS